MVPPAAMLWPRHRNQGVHASQGLGWADRGWQRVPALSLSSMPGSLRAQGLAAFPENSSLPACPVLEPRPSSVPWQDPGGLQREPSSSWSPGRRAGSQIGESLPAGWGSQAHLACLALWERCQWQLSRQTRPPSPRNWESQGLLVVAFRAGGQSLESSKEALCFQGRRQGKGHLPLLDE